MDSDNGTQDRVSLWDGFLEEFLQGLPGATAEVGKELSVIEKISVIGYAENEMAVGNCIEDLLTEPFPEFH